MNKVALIFGGTGGIGQAVETAFKKNKVTVYKTSFSKKKEEENLYHCDVSKAKDVERIVSLVLEREGRIDILINCVTPPLKLKTIESLSYKDFKGDINTILLGGIYMGRAALKAMKPRKTGVIINILSSTVLGGSVRMSSYTSAKYGLLGFTMCLALELTPFNISVFGISPSYVETDLLNAFPEKLIEIKKSTRVGGKLIQPEDVARVVLDLAQNPKKYKTGDNIELN